MSICIETVILTEPQLCIIDTSAVIWVNFSGACPRKMSFLAQDWSST